MTTDSHISGENWEDPPHSNGMDGHNGYSKLINNNGDNGIRRSHNRKHNGYQRKNQHCSSSIVGQFKEVPTVHVNVVRRPFMGRCCNCVSQSKNEHYYSDLDNKGLCNILAIRGQKKHDIISSTWQYLSHGWKTTASFVYSNVTNDVLNSVTLTEAIQKTVCKQNDIEDFEMLPKSLWKHSSSAYRKNASKILFSMQAYFSNSFVRFVAWCLQKVFRHLVSSIIVHRGQMEMISEVCKKKNVPVIFLPNHSSHLDYILLTFILHHYDIRPPHVAAGENLNLPFVGMRLRALGGYFIRRRIDGRERGQKDYVYRAVLQTYMKELLRHNENFEFFVEGGRSRSGKPLFPKGGLLSTIVQSYVDDTIHDAYIVPVSFSYDRLMDGNFMSEQQGHAKRPESLWHIVVSMVRIFRGFYGHIRVNFTQPFSLKEYMRVGKFFEYDDLSGLLQLPPVEVLEYVDNGYCQRMSQTTTASLPPSIPNSPSSRHILPSTSSTSSNCSLINSESNSEEMRNIIHGLAVHVVHSFVNKQALMATHVTAFLLLNKFRSGVSLADFTNSFRALLVELSMRNRDVGFSGEIKSVISHGLRILGNTLVKQEAVVDQLGNKHQLMLYPVVTMPHVIELSYYSNSVVSVFALESVVSLSLNALVPHNIWRMQGHETHYVAVHRSSLVEKATDLCNIFQHDFILKPPCMCWNDVIMEAVDQLISSDILVTEDDAYGYSRSEAHRNVQYYGRDIDDDDCYERDVNYLLNTADPECVEKVKRLQAVLSPYLEVYHFVSGRMVDLVGKNYTEKEFVKYVHNAMKKRVNQKMVYYTECVCINIVKNAIHSLIHLGFIYKFTPVNSTIKYPDPLLRLRGNDVMQVNKLMAIIESYQPHIQIH